MRKHLEVGMASPAYSPRAAQPRLLEPCEDYLRARITAGPDLSGWVTPHGREALGGRPFGDGTPPGPVRDGERVDPAHTPLR